ncbi:unnamed protein product [Urochloa humidicola]
MEISLEASWVGVQRHGQDLADRLAQGFSGLLLHAHPPQLPPWSPPQLLPPKLAIPFEIDLPVVPFVGGVRRGGGGAIDLPAAAVSSLVEIGGRLGQAGYELAEAVQQLARQVPVPLPFRAEGARAARPMAAAAADGGEAALAAGTGGHTNAPLERVADIGSLEVAAAAAAAATGSATAATASGVGAGGADGLDEEEEGFDEEDGFGCEIGTLGDFKKAKGTVNVSATYNTRHRDFESSVVARGDLWRLESSHGSLTSGNDTSPLFLIQLGPLLLVRHSTLLLPVHLSKQHLLWYGYDRKNGMHSLCPAIWSKHRKWMLMSMMCLNPVSCSFMDVQFPNGQLTYVSGEGITASGFFPFIWWIAPSSWKVSW